MVMRYRNQSPPLSPAVRLGLLHTSNSSHPRKKIMSCPSKLELPFDQTVNIISDEILSSGNNLLAANRDTAATESDISHWHISDPLKRYERFSSDCRSHILNDSKVLRRFNTDTSRLDGVLVRKAFDLAASCCLASFKCRTSGKTHLSDGKIDDFGRSTLDEHGHLVEELLTISDCKASSKIIATRKMPVTTTSEKEKKEKSISSIPAPPLKAKLTGDKRLNYSKALICQTTAYVCAELLDSDMRDMTLPYTDIETEKVTEQASLLSRRILGSIKRWWNSKKSLNLSQQSKFRSDESMDNPLPGYLMIRNPFMKSSKPSYLSYVKVTPPVSPDPSSVTNSDVDFLKKIEALLKLGNNAIYFDPHISTWNERSEKLVNCFVPRSGRKLLITTTQDTDLWVTSLKRHNVGFQIVTGVVDLRPLCSCPVIMVTWSKLMDVNVYKVVASAGIFELAIGDYGVDMMGIHASDPNSIIGRFFESLFVESLIGTKEGVVASQKIFTAKRLATEKNVMPSAYLLLMDGIKEEWDRCKFSIDTQGHTWVQGCVKNGIVSNSTTPVSLEPSQNLMFSPHISNSSLFTASRLKNAIQWISEELASDFNKLPDDLCEKSETLGLSPEFICCEVVPGVNYCAILCGRKFANEATLRQHKTAMHAPRGTWLCRTCGGDCITSNARTQHERYCGEYHADSSSAPTSGAKQHGPGVGKRGNISSKSKKKNEPDLISGGTSSVVPALSVINIRDLPPHIKPLLRDPRQTSRTGGGSKKNKERYIYLYRGVCRQSRKGHDRWQSQISFGGTNHYLGTFDSEWDAAAVYAWAHWILYGKEATLKAQREGEEAAESWEQEKKLLNEGVVPSQSPSKDNHNTTTQVDYKSKTESHIEERLDPELNSPMKSIPTASGRGAKRIISNLAVFKAPTLLTSNETQDLSSLLSTASERLSILNKRRRTRQFSDTEGGYLKCQPIGIKAIHSEISGIALFRGIYAIDFNWELGPVVTPLTPEIKSVIAAEYGPSGINGAFASVLKSTNCIFGQPSNEITAACNDLGLEIESGGSVGNIDCCVGGPYKSCSPSIARLFQQNILSDELGSSETIRTFYIEALNETDTISVNGMKLLCDVSPTAIYDGDIIGIGPRVFLFATEGSS